MIAEAATDDTARIDGDPAGLIAGKPRRPRKGRKAAAPAPDPEPTPPPGPPTPESVLDAIAELRLVILPVIHLAGVMGVPADDLTPHLIALTDSDSAYTWEWPDEDRYAAAEARRKAAHEESAEWHQMVAEKPDEYIHPDYVPAEPVLRPVVTLSGEEAERRGLRVSDSGRYWLSKDEVGRDDRSPVGPVILASDLGEDPPGTLDQFPARDPDSSRALRLKDKANGIEWPTVIKVGVRPWWVPGQPYGKTRTGEQVPRPVDPLGPGVKIDKHGRRSRKAGYRPWDAADDHAERQWRAANDRPAGAPCECCGGRRLGDGMLDGERISGGETCLVCDRTSRD